MRDNFAEFAMFFLFSFIFKMTIVRIDLSFVRHVREFQSPNWERGSLFSIYRGHRYR